MPRGMYDFEPTPARVFDFAQALKQGSVILYRGHKVENVLQMNTHGPNMTSKKKQHAATSKLTRMAAEVEEFFRENRARQVSLSLAGILLLLLLLGPAVPQELRADAGSRLANLAQYLDSSLTDAWYSAFSTQRSDHSESVAGNNRASSSQHIGASRILTGSETRASVDASESLVDFTSSFDAGSESNARDRAFSDMLQDGNPGGGGSGAYAGSSASRNGSGGAGHQQSAGMGGSAGGAAPGGAWRSSSGTRSSSARSRNAERTVAHQGQVTGTGAGSAAVFDTASWNQPNGSQNALEPGGAAWSGGAGNDPFPTNGDVAGLNGHPPQGDGGSVFQNGGSGGNGHVGPPNLPDPRTGDPGSFNQPPVTETDPGPVSAVPEPGSLVLLSLGLVAVILWGKLRPAR